ncbi:endo-1,4-beta-xylanase [Hymenobacter gummosus]|uniref:Beta-xylanase n=2 Tax=Hymenobacter gummosus TaxID=1776032 RepID=A0A431U0F5_9BACT|nr:endo-1,4-beta-xylanase [Hymenobacter gummosus]
MPKSEPALKDVYKKDFYVGAALNQRQSSGQDAQATALIRQQFNTISPENLLKWGPVHPRPGQYNFQPADAYVAFGQQHKMFIIGHTLLWHQQTPKWVFEDEAGQPVSREVLLQRLQEHIRTVVGRYKGKIQGWDVVNEAIDDQQGALRKTKWLEILGEDFAAKAFEFAHQADPKAELYYNDYSLYRPEKREGVIRLVKGLQAKGIKVTAIGMQGHYGLRQPTIEQVEASIVAFAKLGVRVNFTELDIDVLPNPSRRQGADVSENYAADPRYNPYPAGLPDSVQQQLARRYADLFALFHKHRDVIDRVTLWGVTDADSWLNNWPIRGRTSYPLLFDRRYQPKPALPAVLQATGSARPAGH